MKIIIAKSAGFCFGVNRAINCVYDNILEKNLYTYGPIIHNSQVVNDLKQKGVNVLDNIEQIDEGTVIIRSHGVAPNIYKNLKNKGIKLIDATCPFVKKIHKIVNEHYNLGHKIIIIGNQNHPEVQGINGWCNNSAIIIQNIEQAKNVQLSGLKEVCVVSQTTFDQYKFNNIVEVLKKLGYNLNVFSTICSSTYERQKEANNISKIVDKMIVVGGKHSSNTQKLYSICQQNCSNTFYIETINDLNINSIKPSDTIGITAGASTPKYIIEEVIDKMNEIKSENMSFEELLNESMKEIRTGEIIKGTVLKVTPTEIIVNIGYKSDGVIEKSEYTNDSNADLEKLVSVGDKIEAFIIKINDKEGQVQLSRKKVIVKEGFDKIKAAYENKETITEKISSIVKGGVIVLVNEVKIFIPVSQLDDHYINDLTSYIGKEITFKIIEFNSRRGRIIGSRKELLIKEKQAKKEKALLQITEGAKIKGVVKRLTSYGAFVDLGGIDGLLHISEMSWGRIKKPSDVLKVEDEVEVLVKEFDKENEKISLTLKFPEQNPWLNAENKYKIGNIVEGKVARLTSFGAFVELETGIDALLHVSQISNTHIEKPADVLNIGQIIKAKVTQFDLEGKKISLSIKALEDQETKEEAKVVEKETNDAE